MDYIILLLIITIFGIGIIIISKKQIGDKNKSSVTSLVDETETEVVQIPSNKIKCPECKKEIDRGLTCCPDYGVSIPKFLRYHPS